MDHKFANTPDYPNTPDYQWVEELQVAEVLAALTGILAVLLGFLNAG